MEISVKSANKFTFLIGIVSVLIPIVVSVLLFLPQTGKLGDFDVRFLPHLNALLNSGTFLCLIMAFFAIKNKSVKWHRTFMGSALVLSTLFLVSYVLFHFQAAPTRFGDIDHNGIVSIEEIEKIGFYRYIYLFILLTHIVLAVVVVPLVLFAFYFALSQQIAKHKKIVKWTFPIWAYVAATGVLVYLMISPYYV